MHEQWLRRVIRHLLHNSASAVENEPKKQVRVRSIRSKGAVRVEIADTGPGIPARVASRLFKEPLEPSDGHSGQGLLIVRFLVELHGGQVGIGTPSRGEGACIFFTLSIDEPMVLV
jgi:signal transduction histidine kinase